MLLVLPIPLGAETTLRSWPRATFTIIALNVLIHLLVLFAGGDSQDALSQKLERMAGWDLARVTRADQAVAARVGEYPSALAFLAGDDRWPDEVDGDALRERLEGYLREYRGITRGHPYHRFGFVPADIGPVRLVAHQFLHADVLHLGFNMLFLYVAGCVLEDRWGSRLFVPLYLGFGIAAALAHAAANPASIEPAIGASGAIAGLMGAFAVQQARTPIRVLLVYGLGIMPRTRLFSIPAVALLATWLAQQLFFASLTAHSKAVPIAFGAHLGGFAAGVVAALLLRQFARGELAERIREA